MGQKARREVPDRQPPLAPSLERIWAAGPRSAPATPGTSATTTLSTSAAASRPPDTSAEAEFLAPRLFDRRGTFSVLGGWREATQVGFYGIGTPNTSKDDRAQLQFRAAVSVAAVSPPTLVAGLGGGHEFSQWSRARVRDVSVGRGGLHPRDRSRAGRGAHLPPPERDGRVDSRTSPGYTRRGGYYGVTRTDTPRATTSSGSGGGLRGDPAHSDRA